MVVGVLLRLGLGRGHWGYLPKVFAGTEKLSLPGQHSFPRGCREGKEREREEEGGTARTEVGI